MKLVYSTHSSTRDINKNSITKPEIVCISQGPGKRGQIVADTLLPMMFLGLWKLGNICCVHKMLLNKIRNIFCVPDTTFVSATNVARAGKRGKICVGNNVSSFARAFNEENHIKHLLALPKFC